MRSDLQEGRGNSGEVGRSRKDTRQLRRGRGEPGGFPGSFDLGDPIGVALGAERKTGLGSLN